MVTFGVEWQAQWIGDAVTDRSGRDRRTVFEASTTVELEARVATAPCRVFAEAAYLLRVNGAEVARGPGRGNARTRRADHLDLADHLRPGVNTISAVVWHHHRPTAWWMPAPTATTDLRLGGFLFELVVDGELVVSDGSWRTRPLPGWTSGEPTGAISQRRPELVDPRPGSWAPAVVRRANALGEKGRGRAPSHPFGALPASTRTPPTTRVRPLHRVSTDHWDAGEVVAGPLRIEVDGPEGATVRIRTAERLDADGHPDLGDEPIGVDLTVRPDHPVVETLDAYGFHHLLVEADDGAEVLAIDVLERLHPSTELTLESSDPELDRIVAAGRRTVSLCSFDAYLDCPTREQRAWTGDSVVHQLVDLTTNDDWTLATWHPHLAASPRPDGMLPMAVAGDLEHGDLTIIPDWALHWIASVWNLHRYLGDRAVIAELLPVAERVLRWFEPYLDDAGCPTSLPGWVIIDWSWVDTEGVSAAICGLWGRALRQFAEMAAWLGDGGRVAWAEMRLADLRMGIERLWDPERRRYADVWTATGRGPTASQHGHATLLLAGLVPEERIERVADLLGDLDGLVYASYAVPTGPAAPGSEHPLAGPELALGVTHEPWWDTDRFLVAAQPFFCHVVHDALASVGRHDAIDASTRRWRHLLDRCPTTLSETWYGGTTCHGWAATPTREFVTRILGVRPAEPGFTAATIDPQLGALEWARGSVPTPAGPIHIEVRRHEVRVEAPPSIELRPAPGVELR